MKKEKIPDSVKQKAKQIVKKYNEANDVLYDLRFRGVFAYLDRMDKNGQLSKIGRLKYRHKTKDWSFDVFKYSSEKYDPDEWMFPGVEILDGTIMGALKAGHEIYPDDSTGGLKLGLKGCLTLIIVLPFHLLFSLIRWIINLFRR